MNVNLWTMSQDKNSIPVSAKNPLANESITPNQSLFLRYYTGFLIDLVVLNLFEEYSKFVIIESFTVSLIVALILQVLLKFTITLEQWFASFFIARSGAMVRFMRYFGAWAILFLSKIVILGIVSFAFGDNVYFGGPLNGAVVFVAVVVTMLASEEVVLKFYRWIGRESNRSE